MDEEAVVHIHKGILFSHKKEWNNENFAATWMDLEIIMLRKSDRERQISYGITCMWNLKKNTNELIYRTETDSHRTQTYGSQRGRRGEMN